MSTILGWGGRGGTLGILTSKPPFPLTTVEEWTATLSILIYAILMREVIMALA
jgi:hypothetical protein